MSPSLHALLSFDAGFIQREFGWFDKKGRFLARPAIEVVGDHAGPFVEMYEPLFAARFPGKAIALDQGSDSMSLLYFGDPDEHGEYPVLFIDHMLSARGVVIEPADRAIVEACQDEACLDGWITRAAVAAAGSTFRVGGGRGALWRAGRVVFTFEKRKVKASMYRTPDGKVQQCLVIEGE